MSDATFLVETVGGDWASGWTYTGVLNDPGGAGPVRLTVSTADPLSQFLRSIGVTQYAAPAGKAYPVTREGDRVRVLLPEFPEIADCSEITTP